MHLSVCSLNVLTWRMFTHPSSAGMSSRYRIVVEGEASETDSDDEVYITSLPSGPTARAKVALQLCVCVCLAVGAAVSFPDGTFLIQF